MKTLKNLAAQVYGDRKVEGPELQFMAKHVIGQFGVTPDGKDYAGNPVDGAPYKATNKYYKRSPAHGHDAGSDHKVYEETEIKEGLRGLMRTNQIKNKAAAVERHGKSMHNISRFYDKMGRKTDPDDSFGKKHFLSRQKEFAAKGDKQAARAATIKKGAKRVAGIVGKMTEETERKSPTERMKANAKIGKKNTTAERNRQTAKTQADFKSKDLDESLLSGIQRRRLAGKLYDGSGKLNQASYKVTDTAEKHGRLASEAPSKEERDGHKFRQSYAHANARKLKNKSNQFAAGAKRVSGVVGKMLQREQHDASCKEAYDKHHANAVEALQGMLKHLKNHKNTLDNHSGKSDWSVTHPHHDMKHISRQLQDTFENLENTLTTNMDPGPVKNSVSPMNRMGGTKYSNWKASN